jgi:hypothetical protein
MSLRDMGRTAIKIISCFDFRMTIRSALAPPTLDGAEEHPIATALHNKLTSSTADHLWAGTGWIGDGLTAASMDQHDQTRVPGRSSW